MGRANQKKSRARKARGRRIVAERRAHLQKQKNLSTKRKVQIKVPEERTILFLFLLVISLVPIVALLVFFIGDLPKEGRPSQTQMNQTNKTIQTDLRKSLPGSFWLKPAREEVRLEKIERGGLLIASLAYLNRAAQRASQKNPSSFTYLLRNEEVANTLEAEDVFRANSRDVWQKGDIFFFISRKEPWREFYLLNKKEGRIALLLNASGKENEAIARDLFSRLTTLEKK